MVREAFHKLSYCKLQLGKPLQCGPLLQFFEDVVPYQDFSVRLGMEDIPHLGPLLRAIDDKEYARLQEGLQK